MYSAAKAAVEQFGRTLAIEFGPDNIRVNNVAPDYTPTPTMRRISGGTSQEDAPLGKRISIPMGRAAR